MKATRAHRISLLSKALADLPSLRQDMRRTTPESYGAEYRAVQIEAWDTDGGGDGCSNGQSVNLDMVTGRMLVPLLRTLIEGELEKLGVTL